MLYDAKRWDTTKAFLPYKALEEGRLPEWVYEALIEVLRRFESGEVEEVHRDKDGNFPTLGGKTLFNMTAWCYDDDCGTVMCIGGFVERVGDHGHGLEGLSGPPWETRLPQLFALCHPWDNIDDHKRWNSLTIPQACIAIRHYLTTGDGKHAWDVAVGFQD